MFYWEKYLADSFSKNLRIHNFFYPIETNYAVDRAKMKREKQSAKTGQTGQRKDEEKSEKKKNSG